MVLIPVQEQVLELAESYRSGQAFWFHAPRNETQKRRRRSHHLSHLRGVISTRAVYWCSEEIDHSYLSRKAPTTGSGQGRSRNRPSPSQIMGWLPSSSAKATFGLAARLRPFTLWGSMQT